MSTIFKYKNKYYQAINLDKKLKRLKITSSDIEILFEGELSQSELEKKYLEITSNKEHQQIEYEDPNRLYYFINPKTGWSITSIHPYVNDNGYEQCTKEYLESIWNKTRSI